jgi:hypothetical protein
MIQIHPITSEETHNLRHDILRPHIPQNELVYPGDDAPESLHAGAFYAGTLVGIASVFRDSPPGETNPTAWRLRGMATHSTMRRRRQWARAHRVLHRAHQIAPRHNVVVQWAHIGARVLRIDGIWCGR